MKIELISERLSETNEIASSISELRNSLRNSLNKAKEDSGSIKILNEIEAFTRNILEEVKKIESGQDKLNVALVGLQKLFEIAKAEPINIRNRILSLEERIAVLGDLEAFLNDKQSIYRGKIDAILRVAAEESPSRPEKLSVVREAKKIKKNK
jgi:uncharacterized protein (UPF0262 family)